jgi:hypothetical protein
VTVVMTPTTTTVERHSEHTVVMIQNGTASRTQERHVAGREVEHGEGVVLGIEHVHLRLTPLPATNTPSHISPTPSVRIQQAHPSGPKQYCSLPLWTQINILCRNRSLGVDISGCTWMEPW